MRKLGQNPKLEDKEDVKVEKASEHVEDDSELKMFSAGTKGQYSLFEEDKKQLVQHMVPTEVSHEVKAADTEEVVVHEEELQVKQKSPITILSDDEGYLLEEEQVEKTEVKAEAYRELSTSGSKIVKPNRKKNKLEMEFSAIKHQGRTMKMLGELALGWRPKNRPKNKFRLNSKKLMNPKLNIQEVTVLDDASSNEEPEIGKMNIKRKEKQWLKLHLLFL